MQIWVIGLQILLGVGLFFIMNWIGRHSYSLGYMEISMFARQEESPAFNFLFRVLTPVVYIIVLAAVFYQLGLDTLTVNLFLVNIFYILFRLGFNLLTGRGRLLNWYRQLLYWAAITVLSVFVYAKFIKTRASILPDFGSMANELWLIILIFLFQVFNNIRIRTDVTEKRKAAYLLHRFRSLQRRFGAIVDAQLVNAKLRALAYAVLVYEDFNRPKAARILENALFRFGKARTLGIMQVTTDRLLSDRESVVIGTKRIATEYDAILTELRSKEVDPWYGDPSLAQQIVRRYNPDDSYVEEVMRLWGSIINNHYKSSSDVLVPEEQVKRRKAREST